MLRLFGSLRQTPAARQAPATTPEQVHVLALTESDRNSVPVAVTNLAETPSRATVKLTSAPKLTPIGPRLFVQSNYVAAVRTSDGAVLSRGVAAMPEDVIELYGTGFGLTTTAVDGSEPADASSASSRVTVTIGGVPADVRFAGRVGPALYQINVTVPADLPSGDHTVIASIGGVSTQGEALVKIAYVSDISPNPEGRYSCFVRKAMEGTLPSDCAHDAPVE
jgi:uncharacterized protein (TIGR03437 family)